MSLAVEASTAIAPQPARPRKSPRREIDLTPLTAEQQQLAAGNLGLAYYVCGRFAGRARRLGLGLDDLVGVAQVALVIAAREFDRDLGRPFSALAGVALRRSLAELLERQHSRRLRPYPEDEHGRPVEPADARPPASDAKEAAQEVQARLQLLNERQRQAIALRFGLDGDDPLTLEEIGDRLGGISKERARQVLAGALTAMREAAELAGAGAAPPRRPRPSLPRQGTSVRSSAEFR